MVASLAFAPSPQCQGTLVPTPGNSRERQGNAREENMKTMDKSTNHNFPNHIWKLQRLRASLWVVLRYTCTVVDCMRRQSFSMTAFNITDTEMIMMTSSNRNIFRVTGPLCGEFTVPGDFPHKGQWSGAMMFSLICVWINDWVNNHEAGDLRRHRGHYDVNVLKAYTEYNRVYLM